MPVDLESLPAPIFLPGESHGQRILEGYGPWGPKESDTTHATWHHTRTCPISRGHNILLTNHFPVC